MSHPYFQNELNTVNILKKIVWDGRATEIPYEQSSKVSCVPLEVKANFLSEAIEIGTEQNILTKSMATKYLIFAIGMKSVISLLLPMEPS